MAGQIGPYPGTKACRKSAFEDMNGRYQTFEGLVERFRGKLEELASGGSQPGPG